MRVLIALTMMVLSSPVWAGEQYLVKIDGMSCPFCVYGVEKQLKKMAGVVAVAVDLASGTVAIDMEDGVTLSEEAVRQAITDAGFSFNAIENVTHDAGDPAQPESADDSGY